MQLHDQDIRTREVLDWQGVHLLHFSGSSCSQKVRIALNLKGLDWVSHPVDLVKQQNYTTWFLGINPRGLVPVLVHDGAVHIESNHILSHLDENFPEPKLMPEGDRAEIIAGLEEEDDLHLDLRALSMRFVVPRKLAAKKRDSLQLYQQDAGSVAGVPDPRKDVELGFWQRFATAGTTDAVVRDAVRKFRDAYLRLDDRLAASPFLTGGSLSLLDVAWFIYTHRLTLAGYPFERLHSRVHDWYIKLRQRDAFAKEVKTPPPLAAVIHSLHAVQALRGRTLIKVAGL